MSDLDIFHTLAKSLDILRGDNAALIAARGGVESALNVWLDDLPVDFDRHATLINAVAALSADQLHQALQRRGAPVYLCLLEACGPDLSDLRLAPKIANQMSNADIELLQSRGFDYDVGKYRSPAADWLVRGAAYGEANFRKDHPRKNPVIAHWEQHGFNIPKEGLCGEGVDLMADVIRDLKLTRKAAASTESRAHIADWRIVFCLMSEGRSIHYNIIQNLTLIFGVELKDAFLKCLRPGTSSHAQIAHRSRMQKLPPMEDVLRLPRDPDSLIPILEALGIKVAKSKVRA